MDKKSSVRALKLSRRKCDRGQSIMEVTLVIALIALVGISMFTNVGKKAWCSFAHLAEGFAWSRDEYTADVDGNGIANNFDLLWINLCRPPG